MYRDLSEARVQFIKGIGPYRAKLLEKIGIETLKNALFYLPYRYEDRRNIKNISELFGNFRETVAGVVQSAEIIKTPRKGTRIFELTISDGTGSIKAKWFNQPFMRKQFRVGQKIVLCGVVKPNLYHGSPFEIANPDFEIISKGKDDFLHTSRIVPIYKTTSGLSVKLLRNMMYTIIQHSLPKMKDPVPEPILIRNHLKSLNESIVNVHFPDDNLNVDDLNNGTTEYHRRLSFDELFYLELGLMLLKRNRKLEKGISFQRGGKFVKRLRQQLPYRLTGAQERVFKEILMDMESPHPMNRLLQGDVGSGKTIVALLSMLTAIDSGYQATMMAPTEILAEQHYRNICNLLRNSYVDPVRENHSEGLTICLLTGKKAEHFHFLPNPVSVNEAESDIREDIAKGVIHIVIGTHTLIQESVRFKSLGLIVIDEQHRFGVMQRSTLRQKGINPDVLIMTATPIPRTLALTLYGDLNYSVIDELPPQRQPVKTKLYFEKQKHQLYGEIYEELKKNGQVYIVYPAIEEDEDSSLHSAIVGKERLEKIFKGVRIGLIHGKMKSIEQERIMDDFKKRKIDILVSTTVIEVGVDVPSATFMIIVHAERFGLSQLHQLRGRVGRGKKESKCVLLAYPPLGDEAKKRLNIMVKTTDGFRVAEEDLTIRGPGEFLGTKQSGMPDLKIANIIRDARWLEIAKDESNRLVSSDPEFLQSPLLKKGLNDFWRGKIELFKTS